MMQPNGIPYNTNEIQKQHMEFQELPDSLEEEASGFECGQNSSSSSEIKKQLEEFLEIKIVAEEYGTPDFASRMAFDSILQHEKELREELARAIEAETVKPNL